MLNITRCFLVLALLTALMRPVDLYSCEKIVSCLEISSVEEKSCGSSSVCDCCETCDLNKTNNVLELRPQTTSLDRATLLHFRFKAEVQTTLRWQSLSFLSPFQSSRIAAELSLARSPPVDFA